MTKSNILIKFRWLLIIGIVLLLLTTVVACQGDFIGPGAQDPDDVDEDDENKDAEEKDPDDTGGIGLNKQSD